jgi:hypothetical protein
MRKLSCLIAVCLVLGTLTAAAEAKSKKKVERTTTASYVSPGGAAEQGAYVNAGGTYFGGVELTPSTGERFVSIVINDSSGQKTAGAVSQDINGDMQADTSVAFCGATTDPVSIDPSHVVTVYVFEGPCTDATPAVATSGTVVGTFSNRA